MRALALCICISVVTTCANAQGLSGCQLPGGYERAERPRLSVIADDPVPGPRVQVETLRRGFDDGHPGSCSAMGVLALVLNPGDVTETEVYSFEAAAGALPAGLLPTGYVESVDLGAGQRGFRFYWRDLVPGQAELAPINAVLRISRTFYDGTPSMPMVLEIADPGGTPETTTGFWNSTYTWIGITLILLAFVAMRMKVLRRPGRRRDELAAIQSRLRELAADQAASRADASNRLEGPADR